VANDRPERRDLICTLLPIGNAVKYEAGLNNLENLFAGLEVGKKECGRIKSVFAGKLFITRAISNREN
jgi:hypothetical protein